MADTDRSTRLLTAAIKYVQAGFCVIPTRTDKTPRLNSWTAMQSRLPTREDLEKWFCAGTDDGIAVVCGAISGNLEFMDFDVRFGAHVFTEFWEMACEHGYEDLMLQLVISETQHGGRHVWYRCETPVSGPLKLAFTHKDEDAENDRELSLIETKGTGGYCLVPPSPGYRFIQGEFRAVPTITTAEREFLHALAKAFDRRPPQDLVGELPGQTRQDGRTRPGDAYNAQCDVAALLESHGARVTAKRGEKAMVRRPGKAMGISGTVNHAGSRVFYCFSSNWYPFEAGRSYTPFAVYAYLEHEKDFAAATRALGDLGFGDPPGLPESKRGPGRPRKGEADEDDSTDLALATEWAESMRDEYRYVEGDQWWRYSRGVWSYSSLEAVQRSLQFWLTEKSKSDAGLRVTPTKIRNLLFLGKSLLGPHSMDEFNARPNTIALMNGIYDTESKQLLEHSPQHLLTSCSPVTFDPAATAPTWLASLQQWMIDEAGTTYHLWIDMLQEWYGYCLTADMSAQASMIWIGEGGNGKGVATRVLENLIGKEYCCAIPVEQLHEPYHRADLYGKLVGLVNEPDRHAFIKNGTWFKAVVGGDRVPARRPTEKVFSFNPTCRIVLSCNELPPTKDLTRAYFRRLIVIAWRYNVPDDAKDLDLDDKLRRELPGILNWALIGLERLQARGRRFVTPPASEQLLVDYKLSQNVVQRFVSERCVVKTGLTASASALYKAYREWCDDGGEDPIRREAFGKRLVVEVKQPAANRTRRTAGKVERFYYGIGLLDDSQTAAEMDDEEEDPFADETVTP